MTNRGPASAVEPEQAVDAQAPAAAQGERSVVPTYTRRVTVEVLVPDDWDSSVGGEFVITTRRELEGVFVARIRAEAQLRYEEHWRLRTERALRTLLTADDLRGVQRMAAEPDDQEDDDIEVSADGSLVADQGPAGEQATQPEEGTR